MVENTLDRRWVLRGAGAAGAAAVGGLALAASASATDAPASSVQGSWLIVHSDTLPGDSKPTKGVVGFAAGGVLVNFEFADGSTGLGTWASQGMNGFMATFWAGGGGSGPNPGPAVMVRVSPRGRVHGDQISGTYTIAIFDASTDAKIASGTGTFSGHRIMA